VGAAGTDVLERDEHEAHEATDEPRWHPLTRIGLRFGIVYFALFSVLIGQIVGVFYGIATKWLPEGVTLWQLRQVAPVLTWVGREVFGVEAVLREQSGSGDQAIMWMLVFCSLVVAAVVALVWSVLDRKRLAYPRLGAWFLTVLRLLLAGQMLFYGIAKAFPSQMPEPVLTQLLQPFGDFSPASVLWTQVGSAPVYEILLGCAELVGGLLLLLPRTATLGALLSLVSMAQVLVLNMTFDVPVKLLALHLVLMALVLLAPQLRRMADMFLLERRADPAVQPPLFGSRRANRIAALVQAVIGLWMVVGTVYVGWTSWQDFGGGAPKPPLYGIWSVSEFRVDGQAVPPLLTDDNRWQRVVFDTPGAVTYQRMNGDLEMAGAEVDTGNRTITVVAAEQGPGAAGGQEAASPAEPMAQLNYEQPAPDRLVLDGQLNGKQTEIELERVDENSFTQRSRGFHWVQEYPYFR